MSNPTFATLERFLLDLGFHSRTIPGSHILFQHPRADAQVALRLYRPEEEIDPVRLAYVRHTLDTWGILSRDEFDERLRNHSLAS